MLDEGEVRNAPSIHRAALHCIALRTLSGYDNGALLENHKGNPYKVNIVTINTISYVLNQSEINLYAIKVGT